jgi:hypothetical protein
MELQTHTDPCMSSSQAKQSTFFHKEKIGEITLIIKYGDFCTKTVIFTCNSTDK